MRPGVLHVVSPQPGMTHFLGYTDVVFVLGSIERARGEVVLAGTVTCSAVGASVGATVNATVNSSVLAACIAPASVPPSGTSM